MSFEYITDTYKVPASKGQRVEYTGGPAPREGVITGAKGAHLLIKLDGESDARRYHPTWELRYLGAAIASEAKP